MPWGGEGISGSSLPFYVQCSAVLHYLIFIRGAGLHSIFEREEKTNQLMVVAFFLSFFLLYRHLFIVICF